MLCIVWNLVRRRVTRHLIRLQTMYNVFKYSKTWWENDDISIYRYRTGIGIKFNLIMRMTVVMWMLFLVTYQQYKSILRSLSYIDCIGLHYYFVSKCRLSNYECILFGKVKTRNVFVLITGKAEFISWNMSKSKELCWIWQYWTHELGYIFTTTLIYEWFWFCLAATVCW